MKNRLSASVYYCERKAKRSWASQQGVSVFLKQRVGLGGDFILWRVSETVWGSPYSTHSLPSHTTTLTYSTSLPSYTTTLPHPPHTPVGCPPPSSTHTHTPSLPSSPNTLVMDDGSVGSTGRDGRETKRHIVWLHSGCVRKEVCEGGGV